MATDERNTLTTRAVRFGILPLDRFALTPFSSFVDMIRLVTLPDRNRFSEYRWEVISPNLEPISSSCGIKVLPDTRIDQVEHLNYVVIVGGNPNEQTVDNPEISAFIRKCADAGATVVGISTGVFALHRAGVMVGYATCVHNYYYDLFTRTFPEAEVITDRQYVVDGNRITCAGGISAIRLAAEILTRSFSNAPVQLAMDLLYVAGSPSQKMASLVSTDGRLLDHPALRRAVALLEAGPKDQPSIADLGKEVGVSARHLERIFQRELGVSPHKYAVDLRLRGALWSILNTRKPLVDIAAEYGFSDQSHLGRLFRVRYGVSPTNARRTLLQS